MRIKLFSFGKIRTSEVASLIDYYAKLTQRTPGGLQIETKVLADKTQQKLNPAEVLETNKLNANLTYFLAEWGREYSTPEFIDLAKRFHENAEDLNLVVGNAYGWARVDVDSRGGRINYLSLSRLIFNHELAQLILWEQLYRWVDSLNGGKYTK